MLKLKLEVVYVFREIYGRYFTYQYAIRHTYLHTIVTIVFSSFFSSCYLHLHLKCLILRHALEASIAPFML